MPSDIENLITNTGTTIAQVQLLIAAVNSKLGQNVDSVGPAANFSNVIVPNGVDVVRTSDVGGPRWRYNASAAALASTIPGAIIFDKNGRGFILDELVITPEMFGATGDGVTNDTTAFQNLTKFVNWCKYGLISFTKSANYLVGRQTAQLGSSSTPAYVEEQVMAFDGVDGLTIIGNGAKIKNAPSLRYGSFDPSTGQRYDAPSGGFSNANYRAATGHQLSIANSTRIDISDLKIDGNSDNIVLGGYWGDKGYQLPGDCLRITFSSFVRLSNLELINSPHDGLYLNLNGNVNTGTAELTGACLAENVLMDRSGRQGCSITGGSGFMFRNCRFMRSGQGRIQSAPMAGCDIEPVSRWASDITFEQCQFVANGGTQLIADSGTSTRTTVRRCVIWGGFDGTQGGLTNSSGHAMWIDKEKWVLEDCEIHGTFGRVYTDTIFIRCRIDNAIHPVYGQSGLNQSTILNNPAGVVLENCVMENPVGAALIGLWNSPGLGRATNCMFLLGGPAGSTSGGGVLGNGIYENCQFIGQQPVFTTPRPQFSSGGGSFVAQMRGVNTVSGNARVFNLMDMDIPSNTSMTSIEAQKRFSPTDDATTPEVVSHEYRTALPTTGFYWAGSIIWRRNPSAGTNIGWVCTTSGGVAVNAWAASTKYLVGDLVLNGGNTYRATAGGVSAASGGPTGTGAAVVDGAVTWRYFAAPVWTTFGAAGNDIPGITAVAGGQATTNVAVSSPQTFRWSGTIAADRVAVLPQTGFTTGRRFRFVRTATSTGAFKVNIQSPAGTTIVGLDPGQWVEMEFGVSAWFISAFGTGIIS